MKSKSEANTLFQKFHKIVETQYNAKIQVLHSNNGGEYQSTELQQYLETQGMIHHTTCSSFVNWGSYAAILLGRNTHFYSLFNQSSAF